MSKPFDMIEWLEKAADSAILEGYSDEYEAVYQVIGFIKSLPKELVENWMPHLLTLEEAAKVFNESKQFYSSDWVVGEDKDSLIGPAVLGSYERRFDGLEAQLHAGAIIRRFTEDQ